MPKSAEEKREEERKRARKLLDQLIAAGNSGKAAVTIVQAYNPGYEERRKLLLKLGELG